MFPRISSSTGCSVVALSFAMCLLQSAAGAADPPLIHSTTNLSTPRSRLSGAELDGKAYFAGGYFYSNVVDIYDPQTGAWTTSQMPEPRLGSGITSAGGRLYIAGGAAGAGEVHGDSVYIYQAATETWSQDRLSLGRSDLAAVHIDNKLMFAGGWSGRGYNEPVIDIYDLDAESWSTASLTSPGGITFGAVAGDKALFYSNNAGIVDIYDSSDDQWSSTTITGLRDHLSVIGVGNLAFFAGGWEHDSEHGIGTTDVVDIYDAATDTWTVEHLSAPRSRIGAAAVGDYVLFAGGFTWENSMMGMSNVVDIYNLQTDQWSVTELSMPTMGLTGVGLESQALFAGVVATVQGERTSLVEVFTIPEPSGSLLALAGLLGAIRHRRWHRSSPPAPR